MLSAFFAIAARSRRRQRLLRGAVAAHLVAFLATAVWACAHPADAALFLGYFLLTAGIVEGAMLLGWRLTQVPKTQALEFLLVSPLRPARIFAAEALVGLSQLIFLTLDGLPLLCLLVNAGILEPPDLIPLLLMPVTWGAVTGLGFIVWAYEPLVVRRWGERVVLVLIVIYLVVGVLAGEHLRQWFEALPAGSGMLLLDGIQAFHRYNPFASMRSWLSENPTVFWEATWGVQAGGVLAAVVLFARAAGRLRGHFHERHYQPICESGLHRQRVPQERPLTWWAVRRVREYSGRVNFWLAGGFGLLYALYTLAGDRWPAWLGRQIFQICEQVGGVPVWATALIVLAAVPAAFQYGLWDSNRQERCRRLELLLLTGLGAGDYWQAAAAAAWRRGRGYFGVAVLLWGAAAVAHPTALPQAVAGLAAGVLLWGLYFTLGFWAFSRGIQAANLGLGLALGLPALTVCAGRFGWPALAGSLPPGSIYYAARPAVVWPWLLGATMCGLGMLLIGRWTRSHCEQALRAWYDKHHGAIVLD
jgi:hypothetical protein